MTERDKQLADYQVGIEQRNEQLEKQAQEITILEAKVGIGKEIIDGQTQKIAQLTADRRALARAIDPRSEHLSTERTVEHLTDAATSELFHLREEVARRRELSTEIGAHVSTVILLGKALVELDQYAAKVREMREQINKLLFHDQGYGLIAVNSIIDSLFPPTAECAASALAELEEGG